MSEGLTRCRFNWSVKEGDPTRFISYCIQTSETPKDISLEDLLNPDACLVLEAESKRGPCEQTISVNPLYRVVKLAILAECSRVESFIGKLPEYNQTHDGRLVFDDESRLYRFDLVFKTDGTSEFIIRYIGPNSEPLCLYRLYLVLERNSNPLETLGSDSKLNQAMIVDHRVDYSKLQLLLGRFCSRNNQLPTGISNNNVANATPTSNGSNIAPGGTSEAQIEHSFGEASVKRYIDEKFAVLEAKIDSRFNDLEARQNERLDEILALLKSMTD